MKNRRLGEINKENVKRKDLGKENYYNICNQRKEERDYVVKMVEDIKQRYKKDMVEMERVNLMGFENENNNEKDGVGIKDEEDLLM